MKSIVSIFLIFYLTRETYCCDTKWIRLVYMMSCGKKKRDSSTSSFNETLLRNMPSDFYGAVKYLKENDPQNPMFKDDQFLYRILEDGIHGFPDQWEVDEINDDKINENHRRSSKIDKLIEECCKVPPVLLSLSSKMFKRGIFLGESSSTSTSSISVNIL
ncbi:hypothetical protein Phum_PHUM055750 [Pediculus humanus corporis]|uniref:Uncharacterized protein n=1 Tax=Pediculus humanus subsp. corporis TaxID=121224 RepID=E0VBA3_PEDHC|nr:uncharacterized protein Phum_PHUM055750 [Pediculus humanus corporis]EEB10659.1 hypothetical protein Phum_PHUM055750 [Pediculus humanus corporis]